ncbi:MFS transporter, DHA1 family, arabinose polymer transporter [Paenibacillus sp. UNCCL117]|uniref:MFS transporter n=1 Tax=unclassified Paenibacillus TaxID=185978 RepID=UPI00087EF7B4|nr:MULTISPECIES: MFS transporter [unclassified Paenibacillus]SDC25556.1 MFS transporter, DHA1 family, arabinose polymer transporter [Paenibacillus sp. cl123]SFW19857.1 MFS transporter, DHA1 family, arabinose polymer transporter [Paenibacillus sp. UNCCL117]
MEKHKEKFPISLLSLTAGAFAIGMTEFVIMGLLPNVAADLQVSIPKAGQLITGYALGVAIGAPVLALATSRLPQKVLLCILMILFIIGNGVAALAPNYGVLMAARLFTSLAHGTFFGVGSVIAAGLVAPGRQAAAVSVMMAGLTVANIIGVPFGTFIGQHMGWRASFVAVVVMGVITLIGIIAWIPKIPHDPSSSFVRQLRALAQPKLLLVLLAGALGCSSLFAVFTYIAPLLQEITGIGERGVTWVLVLFGIGVTLGNIVGGKLADWKLMPTLLVGFLLLAGILAVLGVTAHVPVLAILTIFLWGVAAFGVLPGLQVRIMSLAKDAPALASTSNHSALNLGNAGGAYLGGAVITHAGLEFLPWTGALLSLCGLLITLFIMGWDRRTER